MPEEWDLQPGSITTRAQVAARYGGATQGGIQPSTQSPNVMVYTDPRAGRQHGYNFDGWSQDRSAFYYTGEGQTDDQRMIAGNRAILEHAADGRVLRLFEAVGPAIGRGGKPQRYLGAFRVDPAAPFRREDAPDRTGALRSVLVFRLLPMEPHSHTTAPGDVIAPEPETGAVAAFVASEQNAESQFPVSAQPASTAERREAELMRQLEAHLRLAGHTVGRLKLTPPGSSTVLWTDTYDQTTGRLFEVKGVSTRMAVRLAIGQLLDYRRFTPDPRRLAIALPVRPAEDLVELVRSCDMELVYPSGPGFHAIAAGGRESML